MQGRRDFIKTLMLATSALTPVSVLAKQDPLKGLNSSIAMKAKRLASGQTIGLIAPSSNVTENEDIYYARDVLKSFGFEVKAGDHLFERRGYLAGADELRAQDVNNMFADKDVDGIVCLRGGYGSPRILPYLDYKTIAANPKVIMGYSDVTALLNAIFAKTGLITFHGPIAGQRFSDYTLASFKKVLFEPSAGIKLAEAPPFEQKEGWVEKDNRLSVIVPGKAEGQLIGGNLSLMVSMVGTAYEPDYEGKILFLEDVSEAPYSIDRMLTHLKLAGRLQKLKGIAFGKCTECYSHRNSLSLEQVLNDHLAPLGVPVVRGAMIGHIDDMATIPIGAKAEINTADGPLVLLESAVT